MNSVTLPRLLIFTDLDGTLLSTTSYDPGPARPILERCRELNIPVIFCSSKTAAEIIALKRVLNNPDPFICENGGGIYIPRGTLPMPATGARQEGAFDIIEIGVSVSRLREVLKAAASESGVAVKGMGEFSLPEICEWTGLTPSAAALARERRYDEPFIIERGDSASLQEIIERSGLTMTRGGRFFHILGGADKGKAIEILTDLYRRKYGSTPTIGLGDAENDLPLFLAVDRAFLVQKAPGQWADIPPLQNLKRVEGVGPEGWIHAIESALSGASRMISKDASSVTKRD